MYIGLHTCINTDKMKKMGGCIISTTVSKILYPEMFFKSLSVMLAKIFYVCANKIFHKYLNTEKWEGVHLKNIFANKK